MKSQYADKITYLTPKFNGFQAGFTYTPSYDSLNQNNYFRQPARQSGRAVSNRFWKARIRYDGEFSGLGVHAGGGYTHANEQIDLAGTDDYNEWNTGLKFTWEGFGFRWCL